MLLRGGALSARIWLPHMASGFPMHALNTINQHTGHLPSAQVQGPRSLRSLW